MTYKLGIRFYQTSPLAKQNISGVESDEMQPWGNLDDITVDNKPPAPVYPTLEHNYTVLDGSLPEMPDVLDGYTWGFYSADMSGADGVFASPPTLDISFSEPERSRGLTLYLYMDSAVTVSVTWYSDEAGTIPILAKSYDVSPPLGGIRESVTGYQHITVEFLSTAIPYRYIKMYNLDYGIIRELADDEINKCQIVEEIDPIAEEISVNMAYINIRTRNSFISPITSPDFDDMLMERQLLKITRNDEPFGTFFLESWEDIYQDGVEFDMQAGDAMSILDLYPHAGGMYSNTPITDILDEIFNICFPARTVLYDLDPSYQGATVTGWVPLGTCGLTFQHVVFAINATADTSRTETIRIYPRETDIKADSSPTSSDIQPYINVSDLARYDSPSLRPTLEPNYTLLDGGLEEFPDDTSALNLGWESLSMSDANGAFATPPAVDISFTTSHNLKQLTLNFGAYENEYISKLRLTLFDESNAQIYQNTYDITQNPAVISDWISGYRRMLIECLETSAPYRYAKIAAIDYGRSYFIPLERQYRQGRDRPTDFISGVKVISHDFVASTESIEAYNDFLPLGLNRIDFPEPLYNLTATGGTITESGANYAIINVTTTDKFILSGLKYIDNKRIHAENASAEAGRIEKIALYENYTLISPDIGDERAKEIFEYLSQPISSETDIALDDTQVAHMVQVDTRGNPIIGVVKSLDINLRSNRADMVVVGDVKGGIAVAMDNSRVRQNAKRR